MNTQMEIILFFAEAISVFCFCSAMTIFFIIVVAVPVFLILSVKWKVIWRYSEWIEQQKLFQLQIHFIRISYGLVNF